MAAAAIPFTRVTTSDKEMQNIRQAIESGALCGNGPFTQQCAEIIRAKTGTELALLTHSCTAALEMAAILCDLHPGDEVILPSYTFVSTANPIVLRGATPVFVDIDPLTLNISPEAAAAAVTPRTKAIFAVHYAGVPADMDALSAIAREHGLLLVEDAAQAYGSTYHGRPCGGLGDMAAFSFHETKNIVSGEGGALTVSRKDLADRAEIIWEKGTNRKKFIEGLVDKYSWVDVGSSFLPSELIAAFLHAQLGDADALNAARLAICDRYAKGFADLAAEGVIGLPHCPAGSTGNGHMFYMILPSNEYRSSFIAHMRANGITTPFHYIPLHSAPAGKRFGRVGGPMTVTDDLAFRLVRLPLHAGLGSEVDRVIDVARGHLESNLWQRRIGGHA
jgi:dTDP-4-amino-4,6-dideoxygalactose transaminase